MPPEWRRAISEGRRRQIERDYSAAPMPRKGSRKCTKCGEIKPYDADDPSASCYAIRRGKASKVVQTDGFRVETVCRACQNRARRRWYANLSPEAKTAKAKADVARAGDRRQYQREYRAIRRARLGLAPPRVPKPRERRVYWDATDFLAWYDSHPEIDRPALERENASLARALRRSRELGRIRPEDVDEILRFHGFEHLWPTFEETARAV